MDKKDPSIDGNPLAGKILMWLMAALILGSIGATYWRIVIKKDYIIEAEADCDPASEKCFVYECDSEIEQCTGDPAEDTSYYKLVKRNAANIPLCDSADENCQALVCIGGEKDCSVTFCSDGTVANSPKHNFSKTL